MPQLRKFISEIKGYFRIASTKQRLHDLSFAYNFFSNDFVPCDSPDKIEDDKKLIFVIS
jgi:hypothetical protein